MRVCIKCNLDKEDKDFYQDKRNLNWKNNICKKCQLIQNKEYMDKNPDKRYRWYKIYNWKKRGINNPEQALELYIKTKRCDICNVSNKVLHLDHDHKTGDVRGVICTTCNLGLGAFLDDPNLLLEAITYLNKSKIDKEGNRV